MLTTPLLRFQMNFPFEWQPTIVSHQLAMLGDVALACVPGEFTTMAGRRLRTAVHQALQDAAVKPARPEDVIVVGLCNTYSDYITTPEEYQVQRYEGASTIYGPHTLTVHLKMYRNLAQNVVKVRKDDPVELCFTSRLGQARKGRSNGKLASGSR